ncbi:MAG: electron transfer flavoprotein subunit alpha/FixB family protein [Heliobacteriaceae bacterium]|nr:electron transfer flavoprotein subunit alpha/FixB family protein [Heliobacteriaceae bacterium]
MAGIWVYSEDVALVKQLLTIGREVAGTLNKPVAALTLSEADAADLAAETVYVLKGQNPWPESYVQAIADLAAKEAPDVIFVGATPRGKDLAAKLASILKAGLVTEAFKVSVENGAIETERMMYGGLAVCTEILQGLSLVTIPPRQYEPAAAGKGNVVTIDAATDVPVSVSNVCPIIREGADLASAEKVICVGRGLGKEDDLKIARDLAAAVGGEVGCTRSIAEDYHWLPAETYIGLSGVKVKPVLYLSMGVSGQVQHVAGIRDSKIIVGIDMNENALIFEAADYGIVGDLYDVVPALTEAIKQAK